MAAGFGKVYTVSLPSGNKVKARRGSILSLVNLGTMPSNLISVVWQTFGQATPPSPADVASDPERVKAIVAMMEASMPAVLVQPKVTAGPSSTDIDADGYTIGEVNVQDIPDNDKVILFGFLQGVIKGAEEIEPERAQESSLQTFPAGAERSPSGSDSEAVRSPAEQPAPAAA